jgi:hypothetical protein
MIFKVLFALLTGACMFYLVIINQRSGLRKLFALAFFGSGLVFILNPELTNRLAHFVGIGRGVDLVLYLSTLFLFFISFNLYVRFRELEDRMVVLVRQMALKNPVQLQLQGLGTRSVDDGSGEGRPTP